MCGHPEKRFHLSKVTLLQMNCKLLVDYVSLSPFNYNNNHLSAQSEPVYVYDNNIYIFLFKIRDLCCRPDTQV